MSQRSMEVKVGVLILVAFGLLAGFTIIMGGLSFQPTYTVYVDFDNPGGLKTGAPVRIAGVKIGRVASMEFRGLQPGAPGTEREPLIRVTATLESQYRDAVHENAKWFITTQGVLGEFYLAVDPGSPDRPVLKDGTVVRGVSPPRLDLLLSEAYELLHRAFVGVTDNEKKIAETFDALHKTLKGTGDFFERNGPKLDAVVDDVRTLTQNANDTLLAARQRYVEDPQIGRIITNADSLSSSLAVNVPPLVEEARRAANGTSRALDALASDEQLARYGRILTEAEATLGHARGAAKDAQELVAHVRQGKGTVGAFVVDEALYDDVQELVRDLKHNPWKLFWRE